VNVSVSKDLKTAGSLLLFDKMMGKKLGSRVLIELRCVLEGQPLKLLFCQVDFQNIQNGGVFPAFSCQRSRKELRLGSPKFPVLEKVRPKAECFFQHRLQNHVEYAQTIVPNFCIQKRPKKFTPNQSIRFYDFFGKLIS